MRRVVYVASCCLSTAFSFAAYVGCGGASSSDALAPPADGAIATDASGGDSIVATEAGPMADGSAFTDGPPTTIADGGGGSNDSGPGGNATQIPCGSATCALATSFCCVYTNNNPPPPFSFACASGSGCPTRAGAGDSVALACSSQANCAAGTVCCVKQDGNRLWSECVTSCVDNGNTQTAQLCDPLSSQSGCPASAPCSTRNIDDWKLPNGFGTCGGRGN